ncbi:Transcription elongation factor A protein [Musa troglodytarum]|uniref:Transcription elongation factor n=1 Tax=Musa troglodytarum TaxID=320322 RepID=A0A9E7G4E2_9LILI|nr:Transcription elongation factor A protein [Musa troglodytarum]
METELLETFEAAKKAAEAADDGRGLSEVDRCVDALRRLKKMPVTTKDLVATQVGKRLRFLTKHSQDKIRTVATDLLQFWKNVVIQETSKDNKKLDTPQERILLKSERKTEQAVKIKSQKISKAGSLEGNIVSKPKSVEVEQLNFDQEIQHGKVSRTESVRIEKTANSIKFEKANGGEKQNLEGVSKDKNQENFSRRTPSTVTASLKLASTVKCNNPVRDRLRELLAEAFSRVSKETAESETEEVRNIQDEVDACDPIRMAVALESVLFEKLGASTGAHKHKYRSIMFNLKDNNNKDFRRRVLLGHVKPEEIVNMTAEDMASDERKRANKQIKEKALFECERGAAPKATTDQFKCGRCGQRKTTYYQMQTRSADEPMTTFVTCVNCNNHWKFC